MTQPSAPPVVPPSGGGGAIRAARGATRPAGPAKPWPKSFTVILLAILLALIAIGCLFPLLIDNRSAAQWGAARLWDWLLMLVLIIGFVVVAGRGVTGLWRGALIDDRNRISLSRLQILLWTGLVVSGYLAGALWNVMRGQSDPLGIAVPAELWEIIGISTASLVGSSLILSTKKDRPADPDEGQASADAIKAQEVLAGSPTNTGQVLEKEKPEDSRWADIFKGDETGNGSHLDISKVQMFFFTVVLVLAYAVALGRAFFDVSAGAEAFTVFPALDQSMVALLAISHVGYLSYKAAPHSSMPPRQ